MWTQIGNPMNPQMPESDNPEARELYGAKAEITLYYTALQNHIYAYGMSL